MSSIYIGDPEFPGRDKGKLYTAFFVVLPCDFVCCVDVVTLKLICWIEASLGPDSLGYDGTVSPNGYVDVL